MEINREFWSGNTRKITDGDSSTVVEFLDNSLYTDITANPSKYQGVEWDKSVTPWKVNYQSDFFNLDYMLGYGAGYEELIKIAKTKLLQERKKGYTFYLSSNGGNNTSNAYARYFPVWLATLSRSDLDLTDNVVNAWVQEKFKELHPVIDFDYSKIFAVPTLQAKNEGTRTLFRESLRASWNPANWSGVGVALLYRDSNDAVHDLALEMVSLNNKFNVPDWTTADCFNDESAFDNGLCITAYDIQSTSFIYRPLIGERFQRDTGATGTYYYPTNYATDDAAGSVAYYPNREIWVNASDNPIYDANYYGGFIGNNSMRPYRRTFATSATFDDVKEYLMQQLAYLGFRFCPDGDAINNPLDSEYFYLPEINENGVTTGNYYRADSADAAQLPNNSWSTNVFSVTPYDGTDDDEDGDNNNYDDSNTTVLNPIAGLYANDFQNSYVLDLEGGDGAAGLADVAAYLYYTAPTNDSVSDYLTNNPIDAIISCTMFPFQVNGTIPASGLPFVRFGKVTSDLKALGFISSQIQIIDCGECTYYPEYGIDDFRSYEPYCDAELILPYCGSVKISPTLIYCKTTNKNFHKISVKYIVDLISGACLACVFLDNLLIETSNGQIGLTVPVTGVRSADLQRDIFNKQTGLKQAANTGLSAIASTVFGTIGGLSSGDGTAAVKSLANGALSIDSATTSYKAAEYELKHIQVPFTVRAAASPLTDFANEQFPRMIIKRPVMLDYEPEVYAHSVGYACLITGKLSDYGAATGETPQYIECTGLDLSGFSGTETEKARLKAALEGGLYL